MNKTIRDGPQISTYYTRDYFWRTYQKFLDEGYVIEGIYPENTILEINFGDYDIQVDWIKKLELDKKKEMEEWEKYAFNCFNKRYEHKPTDEERKTN